MAKKLLEGFGSTRRICAVVETTQQTIKFDTESRDGAMGPFVQRASQIGDRITTLRKQEMPQSGVASIYQGGWHDVGKSGGIIVKIPV